MTDWEVKVGDTLDVWRTDGEVSNVDHLGVLSELLPEFALLHDSDGVALDSGVVEEALLEAKVLILNHHWLQLEVVSGSEDLLDITRVKVSGTVQDIAHAVHLGPGKDTSP